MLLHATVVEVQSGSKFRDHKRRITLRVHEADPMFSEFTIASDDLMLDAEVRLQAVEPVLRISEVVDADHELRASQEETR